MILYIVYNWRQNVKQILCPKYIFKIIFCKRNKKYFYILKLCTLYLHKMHSKIHFNTSFLCKPSKIYFYTYKPYMLQLHKMLLCIIFYLYSKSLTTNLEKALNQISKICIAKMLNKWRTSIRNIQATIQTLEFFRIHEKQIFNDKLYDFEANI